MSADTDSLEIGGDLNAGELILGHDNVRIAALQAVQHAVQWLATTNPAALQEMGTRLGLPVRESPTRSREIRIGGSVRADTAIVGNNNVLLRVGELAQSFAAAPLERVVDHLRRVAPTDAVLSAAEALHLLPSQHGKLERNIHPSRAALDPAQWRRRLAAIEGCVGVLERAGQAIGTCFLVGPDLVLTNYHVVSQEILLQSSTDLRVRFDYREEVGELSAGRVHEFLPRDFCLDCSPYSQADTEAGAQATASADELDHAVLRLAASVEQRTWLSLVPRAISAGEPLLILQHPRGARLKLCFGNTLPNQRPHRLRYDTNTDAGASGSPCFNERLELVAIHQLGDTQGTTGGGPAYNQGVPIASITSRLQRRSLRLAEAPL